MEIKNGDFVANQTRKSRFVDWEIGANFLVSVANMMLNLCFLCQIGSFEWNTPLFTVSGFCLEEMSNKVSGYPLIFDDFHIVFVSLHQYEYFFLSASICVVGTDSIQLIMCCVVVELSYALYIVC